MKIVVVGNGGREHALVKALAQSPSVAEVIAIPGSAGMVEAKCLSIDPSDFAAMISACKTLPADLVVIGPENYLAAGLADALRGEGLAVFGPEKRAAQLEASKVTAKEFMTRYQIPTAKYSIVSSVAELRAVSDQYRPPYVLKADGLAGGKGVFICQTLAELYQAGADLFEHDKLGLAGRRALLEQFQTGYEISYFILTNGEDFVSLPLAQDHKRLADGDSGPNTGGMGTVAPYEIDGATEAAILTQVIQPTVRGLKGERFLYRGVVFVGLMMTEQGPQVLEYNVRFGDPETQVLLPLLAGDWARVLLAIAQGEIPKVHWRNEFAVCVVLAAEGYPDHAKKNVSIAGDLTPSGQQYFLHAGTKAEGKQWLTNGGRVLNAIGLGHSKREALQAAYEQARKVRWAGLQMRSDIGHQWTKKITIDN